MLRRSRELKPLSSEHQHALLVAFQLKKGATGHADSAGAPRDLEGLLSLARRFQDGLLTTHHRTEEELLGRYLLPEDGRRLRGEHGELGRLAEAARISRPAEARAALLAFAELLERHVHWEERELYGKCEARMGEEGLATVGQELEKRLVLARSEGRSARRS